MSCVDITCEESFSMVSGKHYPACVDDKLRVLRGFTTYLNFAFPLAAFMGCVENARLILYKIPMNGRQAHPAMQNNRYSVCPLLDFFSIYGNWYRPTAVDHRLCVLFEDQICVSYTEVDVTEIVRSWALNMPENKGLLLNAAPNARPVLYASNRYRVAGMRPFLRLSYSGITPPLSAAEGEAEVKAL